MQLSRTTYVLAVALTAALALPAAASADDAPLADQIIVRHAPDTTAAQRADTRADAGTTLEESMPTPDTEVVAVEHGTRAQAVAELNADPDVLWAAPNVTVHALGGRDAYFGSLYGLNNIGGSATRALDADTDAVQAWEAGYEGAGVSVGVVDSGVASGQEDLAGRLDMAHAKDFVDNDLDPQDGNGHGTHVTGIIAANVGNGLGVAGIAPRATVVPIRALNNSGSGTLQQVVNAFDYAGTLGLKIVNASLGVAYGSAEDTALTQVMNSHPGTLYVVAAGNDAHDNDSARTLPCSSGATNVLCVGATTGTDAQADYSNWGRTTVDLFAPGSEIVSTWAYGAQGFNGQYASLNGTSMASPYAAGAAALVAQRYPSYTATQIATALKASVDPVTALANRAVSGGRLNAARAVGAPVDAPSRTVSASATGDVGQATISWSSAGADVTGYRVFGSDFALLTSTTGTSATITGAPAGTHAFYVVASFADGTVSAPALATATVASAPAPSTGTTPVTSTPTTGRTGSTTIPDATSSPSGAVTDAQIVTRRGRKSLVFRVTRSQRITVTLLKQKRGRYRRTSAKTQKMAAGLQSLPITSKLLGMKVPAGKWQVTVGTGSAVATVAFVHR